MSDGPAWERMLASMRAWLPGVAVRTEGFRCLRLDGVLATVTPAVPDRSLPNSVVYESEDALEVALDDLAGVYEEAGVRAWTVWAPEHHDRARRLLEGAGHVLDASPAAMIATLSAVEPPRSDDPEPVADPRAEEFGSVNDRAYGLTEAFTVIAGEGPLDPANHYVLRGGGEAIACVETLDFEGDCGVYVVAVVPEARGRGLTGALMRRALADGRARGCEVSTLQSTKLGQPVYERLGYREFGVIEMWERRGPGA